MRKIYILTILAALLLCGCGQEKAEAGEWKMPDVDSAPTAQPTERPTWGGQAAERYVWNEGARFSMTDPGVTGTVTPAELNHAETLELFGGQFLPKTIFNESYGAYERMYLEQVKHNVLLDAEGELAENAYVEYRYLNKAWVEAGSITVYAELCEYDSVMGMYISRAYPHLSYTDGALPALSTYYLQNFVLTKIGDARYAQWLVFPPSYLSYVEKATAAAMENEEEPSIQRLPLLTFTCRENVTDEQFIAAVREISQASQNSIRLPSFEENPLPKPGEKGAA